MKNPTSHAHFTPEHPDTSFYADRLNLGVDGGVTEGRTRVGGGYYYDMMDKKWKPVVGVKFRLVEFYRILISLVKPIYTKY